MNQKAKKAGWYILFTMPLLFIFTVVQIVPFFVGVRYSFYSWDGMPGNPSTFVGFDNFIHLANDARFLDSAQRSVVYTIFAVVLINIVGLAFALVVTSKLKASNLGRTMLFMPFLIGGLILGYIWSFILGQTMSALGQNLDGVMGYQYNGVLVQWMVDVGIIGWLRESIFFNWIIHPRFAFISLLVVMTWQMAGYIMIIYITGLQAISDEVIEAASVDGAGFFATLFRIKFPLLMPAFTVSLFLTLRDSFRVFDINLSLTGGGPANATEMIAMNIFNELFRMRNFGYGQAKALIFLIIVATITLIQVRITKKREVMM